MDELSYAPVYDEKTQQFLEQQFSRLKGECYVDHAGATLYSDNQIKKSVDGLLSSLYTNPHSNGVNGTITEETIDNIRYSILDHFHTTQDEYTVIFTSGATASLKLVAETFNFKNASDQEEFGNFVYLQDNHTSVLGMRETVAQKGAKVTCIDHDTAFEILQDSREDSNNTEKKKNSLFVYSAQCNFSGLKYPLDWIKRVKSGRLDSFVQDKSNWFVLLDAASFVATNDLDLSVFKPDFICLSFYKLFGYPTGIGALLVKNDSAAVLNKIYYGGGTVDVVLSSRMFHVKRESLHQRFEDGTISFLTILSLQHGFKILSEISMHKISSHVFSLARYLHHSLLSLNHQNGAPAIQLYSDTDFEDKNLQGAVIAFNVLRGNGEYVGYMEVLNMAGLYKIHLRTGCFCNPGACQRHLKLSDSDVLKNYDGGYTCGGTRDLIDGKPTGAVRVSFGYMSTIEDVETVLIMLKKCFVNGTPIMKYPSWWSEHRLKLKSKFKNSLVNDHKPKNISNGQEKNGVHNNTNGSNQEKYPCNINNNNNNMIEKTEKYAQMKLSKIFVYPIKSCAAYEVQKSWKITAKGLQYDREWMIVTSTGVCLTQKQDTRLCLIRPTIDLENDRLELNYPNMPPMSVPLSHVSYDIKNGALCRGRVCGHKVEGIDCGAEISEWLSLALGKPNLRLIRQTDSLDIKRTNKPDLSFASQSQYLLINRSSIEWLADRIGDDSECDKRTMLHRFRGNFFIEGFSPFEEIEWKTAEIGDCYFEVEGQCNRCQMICIDQLTGKKTIEPLRTLAEEFHGKLKFGIYLKNKFQGNYVLSVGDKILSN